MTLEEIKRANEIFEATSDGALIRRARESEGLSLRELAKKLGVSPKYLSDVEHGRNNLPTEYLEALKQALPGVKQEIQQAYYARAVTELKETTDLLSRAYKVILDLLPGVRSTALKDYGELNKVLLALEDWESKTKGG